MKKIIFTLLILIFLVSCTTQNETQKEKPKLQEFSSFVVDSKPTVEVNEMPIIKTVTIRAVDKGFSPDTVIANVGDRVGLYFTNTRTLGVETISITDHQIEDFYHSGNTIYLEFEATTKGEFDFGDDRASSQKGKIIVQ
jgi:hypothetical protein